MFDTLIFDLWNDSVISELLGIDPDLLTSWQCGFIRYYSDRETAR